ncbi:hypothetical protein M3640_21220, partial [Bacillus velezensis]|nr:hypothetical protein [Bacillus velezensis]
MNQTPVSDAARPGKLLRMLHSLENTLFGHRRLVLGLLVLFTVVMACFAVKLRMDAGFEKQLPLGHEYTETFNQYRGDLLAAVRDATSQLHGAYAIAVFSKHEPQRLIGARAGSPLVVGVKDGECYLASDALALAGITDRFIFLEE